MKFINCIKNSLVFSYLTTFISVQGQEINPNWADISKGATAQASSYNANPVKITINELWLNSGKGGTGLAKIRAYSQVHNLSMSMQPFEMYNYIGNKPVKSVKV